MSPADDAPLAAIEALWRYPVKGLAGERLERTTLTAGEALPHDRRFGLVAGSGGGADTSGDSWVDYGQFYALSREERLAQLGVVFDEAAETLTVTRHGRQVARGRPTDPVGRSLLDQFFAAFLADSPRGTPRFLAGRQEPGRRVNYTDTEQPTVSLLNLASVADMERVARQAVDPRRFRMNVWLTGLAPWAERDWVGRRFRLGGAVVEVIEETERCAATAVNPDSAERDLNVPRLLRGGYGHLCQGVYAIVREGGEVAVGDGLVPLPQGEGGAHAVGG